MLQDAEGQITEPHSVSAGLDYPGVGPEHAYLKASNRAQYVTATDNEALDAAVRLARLEGILPALESAHALAAAGAIATRLGPGRHVIVTVSGRGDKDLAALSAHVKGPTGGTFA